MISALLCARRKRTPTRCIARIPRPGDFPLGPANQKHQQETQGQEQRTQSISCANVSLLRLHIPDSGCVSVQCQAAPPSVVPALRGFQFAPSVPSGLEVVTASTCLLRAPKFLTILSWFPYPCLPSPLKIVPSLWYFQNPDCIDLLFPAGLRNETEGVGGQQAKNSRL